MTTVTREPPLSSNGENAKHPHFDCEHNSGVVLKFRKVSE